LFYWILCTICIACSAGNYTIEKGSLYCTKCPRGQYQGSTGQSQCLNCEAGKYSMIPQATNCESCEIGYTSTNGASSCDLADLGYYLKKETTEVEDDDDSFESMTCPNHATCLGNYFVPIPNNGYWVDRSSSIYIDHLYHCPRDTCHNHIRNYSCWTLSYLENNDKDDDSKQCVSEHLLCTKGAYGPLCGSCGKGYVFRSETKTCEQCQKAKDFVIFVFSIGITFIILGIILKIAKKYGILSTLSTVYFKSFDSGSLKVLWVTYQIIVSVSWNLDVKFPILFGNMLSLLSVLSLDILSVECFQSYSSHRYFVTVYLWSMIPIAIAFIIIIIGTVRFYLARVEERNAVLSKHIWLLLLLSYLVLPPVTMKQLQGLDCIPFKHDDSSYLRIDTAVDCNSESYLIFKTINILCFSLYQLIPITWAVLLFRHRNLLHISRTTNGSNDHYLIELNERETIPALAHLRFLFKDYKGDKWWFEVAEMYRRIMFIGVLPLFTPNASKRASLGCIFSIMSFVYFREEEPFREAFTNSIACIAQITILLTFYTALSIASGVVMHFGLGDFGTGIFLIGINVLILV